MIINLFLWIYISMICLVWGNIFIDLIIKKITNLPAQPEFAITNLIGFSAIGVISFYLSLFIPLNFTTHCIILIPALLYCLSPKKRNDIRTQIVSAFKNFSVAGYSLLFTCFIMALIISADKIIHPDTLAYHVQLIQWFQKYKAVPGIVNLRLEFGFQSIYFAAQAIFKAVNDKANYFPLGGCLIVWYFIFIIKKIDAVFLKKKSANNKVENIKWGWLLLLAYTLFSFTQVRLTIASASPDFIVALLILAAIYMFYQNNIHAENKNFYLLLTVIFSCIAFTTKLSSVCILLLPVIIIINFLYKRNFKIVSCLVFTCILIILPFLIRNFIASGYILYPSSYPDFFNPDWKLKISNVNNLQNYITAYARYPVTFAEAQNNIQLSFIEWIPIWWKHLAAADSILLSGIFLLLIMNIVFLKSFIKKINDKFYLSIFSIVLAGSILWFIKAPDPRFGTGFLIPLIYLSYLPQQIKIDFWVNKINPLIYKGIVWSLIVVIISYSGYRLHYFFNSSEIIYPAGIEKPNYKKIDYNNISMYLVTDTTGCGLTPVPCITDTSQNFIPRGKLITDGFKSRK